MRWSIRDVIMGAAVTSDPDLHAALHDHRNLHGTIPGPMEVFLVLSSAVSTPASGR
ncbi:hypothetical protein [Nesterenkonia ebinurensis]|uniref:hypothetical protein n=1 Tax=Nesterenkonia ebinurensis TaxID=2608252 RepID=UPI00168AFC2A|nr:hypothetical protein [Nesterenkonia ebinurensis]